MAELYLRRVSLDVIPLQGSIKKIEGLRIKFKVGKQDDKTPNKAEIEVYNLSKDTRSIIEGEKISVRLTVGYQGLGTDNARGNLETIFFGNIHSAGSKKKKKAGVSSKLEGVDLVTKINAIDGLNRFRNARLDKGYPPNTKLKDILDDMAVAMGLGVGIVEGIPDKNYANGISFSGNVKNHLTDLCLSNGLEWSIQDETLQIIPENQATSESIILLNKDTGLIGVPESTDAGCKFEALLNPKLRPGRRVKIESKVLNGVFKVRKGNFDGDSHGGEFLSKCEATKIK